MTVLNFGSNVLVINNTTCTNFFEIFKKIKVNFSQTVLFVYATRINPNVTPVKSWRFSHACSRETLP